MSAALWHFFWSADDWGGTTSVTTISAGSGAKRKKGRKPPYIRAPDDFWEARERYLEALRPEMLIELPASPAALSPVHDTPRRSSTYNPLPRYLAERTQVISDLQSLTSDLDKLKATGARLIAINRAISIEKRYQAGQRAKRRQIRSKKLLTLLSAAQALLSLLHRN